MPHLDFDILVTMTHGHLTLTGTTASGLDFLRSQAPELIDGLSLVFPDFTQADAVFATLDAKGLFTLTLG